MSSSYQLGNTRSSGNQNTDNNQLTPFGFSQDFFNWDPFREIRSMNSFFNHALTPFSSSQELRNFMNNSSFTNQLQPMKLDIIENPNEYVVRADVPGYTRENVKIEVDDATHTLHISAENRNEREDKGEKDGVTYHRVERSSGNVYRSLRLPENTDATKISATVNNGVLNVSLPKKANQDTPNGRRRVNIV